MLVLLEAVENIQVLSITANIHTALALILKLNHSLPLLTLQLAILD